MSEMIERVARAIMKRRFYDCEPDMYGNDLDLFFKQVDPDHCIDALDEARAAIEAMKDPSLEVLGSMFEAMFEDKWNCSQAPMVGAGWDAGIEAALNEQ